MENLMESGKITKIFGERGFAFVRDSFGAEHFFHHSSVANFGGLAIGDIVTFDVTPGRNGRTCAVNVRLATP
jgi:cold shock CspA family protein